MLAGGVWSLAFPHPSLVLAGWLTPALLLALSHAPRTKRIFALGYVAGLTHYLSSLYWVLHNPFLSAAIAGWLVLSAYCALYPAIWVWFCWKIFPGQDAAGLAEAWLRLRRMPLKYRMQWPLQCALAWVGLECLRGWMLTGFPWNFLANSQLDIVPLALFASITGVLGVSLVVAWCSVSLLVATTGSAHLRGAERYKRVGVDAAPALGFLALALIVSWLYTNSRERQITKRDELRIAMVQPSISQQVIFDSYNVLDKAVERWEKMEELTFEANATKPNIIIWPEASAPIGVLQKLDGSRQYGAPIAKLAKNLGTPMIAGTDEAVEEMVGTKKSIRRHNSCLLLDRHGNVGGTYRKRHLVMFGEYVPLEKWFPFLRNFVPVEMSFVPGDGPKVFDLGKAKAAPIICFEDVVYPMVRKAATEEVDFLVNLTNDGWFGESNQQWQHARTAAFRAIETGRPLVRCTNNGLTCWVDRFGRIHKLEEADIYAPGIRVAEIPLVDHANGKATFYQRTGDWLGWGSVIAFGLMLVWRFWPKKDSAGEPDMA